MLSQIWIFDHKIFECCMFVDYQDEICDDIFVNNWNKFPSYDDKTFLKMIVMKWDGYFRALN